MLVDKLKGLPSKPRFALHKFSSCDGCQLNLVNDALSLLTVAQLIDIVHFAEAGPVNEMADVEVAFIEGSVNTHHDVERIREIRSHTKYLIAIGACATSGGIQGFRNNISKDKFAGWMKAIYPQHTDVIEEHEIGDVQPISKYVTVDFELRGCPVSPPQMYGTIRQLLFGVEPEVIKDSVCTTCKHRGITCVMVARNEPCLGPVTADGCDALCPNINRGCYGCYGPSQNANYKALTKQFKQMGLSDAQIERKYHFINNQAEAFKEAGVQNVK